MLRYKTELAWFSRLVRHLARKWSGSILTTPESAQGHFGHQRSFATELTTSHLENKTQAVLVINGLNCCFSTAAFIAS